MSDEQLQKIACFIRTASSWDGVLSAEATRLLQTGTIKRIYVCIPTGPAGKLSIDAILSKQKAIYGQIGVGFSEVSRRPGRLLIYAYSLKPTSKSAKDASPTGVAPI